MLSEKGCELLGAWCTARGLCRCMTANQWRLPWLHRCFARPAKKCIVCAWCCMENLHSVCMLANKELLADAKSVCKEGQFMVN